MMPILRKAQHRDGYTVVDNEPIRDGGLSLKALGLLVIMLHLPNDWQFTESGLRQFSNDGRDSMRKALGELEAARYVVRIHPKRADGSFEPWVWYVSETPIPRSSLLSDLPILENPALDSPILENPALDSPILENPTLLNTELLTTELPITEKTLSGKPDRALVAEIVAYLNERTGKHFKATTKATERHISARVRDGYAPDDFKRVIDAKAAQWGSDPNMCKFLRPETLFGSKFESYLNESPRKAVSSYDKYED